MIKLSAIKTIESGAQINFPGVTRDNAKGNYGRDYTYELTHTRTRSDLDRPTDTLAWSDDEAENSALFAVDFSLVGKRAMPDQRQQSIIIIEWVKLRINYASEICWAWITIIHEVCSLKDFSYLCLRFWPRHLDRKLLQPSFAFDSWNNNKEIHLRDVLRKTHSSCFQ